MAARCGRSGGVYPLVAPRRGRARPSLQCLFFGQRPDGLARSLRVSVRAAAGGVVPRGWGGPWGVAFGVGASVRPDSARRPVWRPDGRANGGARLPAAGAGRLPRARRPGAALPGGGLGRRRGGGRPHLLLPVRTLPAGGNGWFDLHPLPCAGAVLTSCPLCVFVWRLIFVRRLPVLPCSRQNGASASTPSQVHAARPPTAHHQPRAPGRCGRVARPPPPLRARVGRDRPAARGGGATPKRRGRRGCAERRRARPGRRRRRPPPAGLPFCGHLPAAARGAGDWVGPTTGRRCARLSWGGRRGVGAAPAAATAVGEGGCGASWRGGAPRGRAAAPLPRCRAPFCFLSVCFLLVATARPRTRRRRPPPPAAVPLSPPPHPPSPLAHALRRCRRPQQGRRATVAGGCIRRVWRDGQNKRKKETGGGLRVPPLTGWSAVHAKTVWTTMGTSCNVNICPHSCIVAPRGATSQNGWLVVGHT